VHVCAVRLSAESSSERRWRGVLSVEERAQADRFVFEKDRLAYTITRGILRTLLGRYLDAPPAALTITTNSFGKPDVPITQSGGRLTFNVSHSGDYALLAFAAGAQVGVDIEEIKAKETLTRLAQAVLSTREFGEFLGLPEADRRRAFFRAWTRKEAFVKGIGEGLSIPLTTVEAAGATGWSIQDLEVHPDYAAALAVRSVEMDLRLWNWGSLFPERES
jgi:4'-phosphopantetheinyl transferase